MTAPVPAVLNLAADLIEQRGWWQGPSGWPQSADSHSPLCLEGGILAALGLTSDDMTDEFLTCPTYQAVQEYLGLEVGVIQVAEDTTVIEPLYEWNDKAHRTAAGVIAALRACALVEAAKVLPLTPSPAHAERAGVGS